MQEAKQIKHIPENQLKKILVVEKSTSFANKFNSDYSEEYQNAVDFQIVKNIELASKSKNLHQFDLCILGPSNMLQDENTLNMLIENFSEVPVIIINESQINVTVRNRLNIINDLKPGISPKEIAEIISTFFSSQKHGYIYGFSLDSIIQTVSMEKKTCTLYIHKGSKTGAIFFRNGELLDAEIDNKMGQNAVNEMFDWHNVELEIIPGSNRIQKKIEGTLFSILMEAYINKDEAKDKNSEDTSDNQTEKQNNDVLTDLDDHLEFLKSIGIENDFTENILDISHQKEEKVKIGKVNQLLENLKDDMGAGLLATDIFVAADGQAVAGINSKPKASALFNQMTDYLVKALAGSGMPKLGNYYMIDLQGNAMVVILPLGKYRQGLLVNKEKSKLGLLLNVILPEYLENIREALDDAS